MAMTMTSPSPTFAAAVAVAASGPNETDHLSKLPDELLISILSLLPTHIAGRTSVLSRRFRHLWEASPSLDLVSRHKSNNYLDLIHECRIFFDMAARAFLCRTRNPFLSLPSLRLLFPASITQYHSSDCTTSSLVSALLLMAHRYGLRHLTIQNSSSVLCIARVLFVIFSLDTLTSLSLDFLPDPQTLQQFGFDFFSAIALPHLTNLSLRLSTSDLPILDQLLSRLSSLQDLQLSLHPSYTSSLNASSSFTFTLSARTINKLILVFLAHRSKHVTLSLSSLESLNLVYHGQYIHVPDFRKDIISSLKKAIITLNDFDPHSVCVAAVANLFAYISHVEELSLHAKENPDEKYPIPTLLDAANVATDFPNLKNLDATLCCHEHNISAIVKILAKSPAIESLKLVHVVPELTGRASGREKTDWESKLPHNTAGIYHKNLHLGEKKKELINFLSETCISKKAQKKWYYERRGCFRKQINI